MLFDRKFLRNFPIKQNAPLRMRTRAIGIMSQKRPRSARESRKRDSFLQSFLSVLNLLSFIFYPLSFILYSLSSILYPLSSILYPLSSILYSLTSYFFVVLSYFMTSPSFFALFAGFLLLIRKAGTCILKIRLIYNKWMNNKGYNIVFYDTSSLHKTSLHKIK